MNSVVCGERKLTELDFVRLSRLAASGAASSLEEESVNAEVVTARAMPTDVVTMYAEFVTIDVPRRRRQAFVLCYPQDADATRGHISVLSPAGVAFIGLRLGDVARWRGPRGEENAARIEEILFQPEAGGDYLR